MHPDHPDYSYEVDPYLDSVARRLCYKAAELCNDEELQAVKAELQHEIEAAEKAIQSDAAKAANRDDPF